MNPLNLYATIQFVRRLAAPFKEWPAYKQGIIDERGNQLKKFDELTTTDERSAWTRYDLLISKIKKLLEKVPGGKSRLASYSAALWLIKEADTLIQLDDKQLNQIWNEDIILEELSDIQDQLLTEDLNARRGAQRDSSQKKYVRASRIKPNPHHALNVIRKNARLAKNPPS